MALYELDGHKVVTPGRSRYWVAPSATVIGRVALAEDVSVWFNAVIRGDNEPISIGARTSIQEGCVLHVDVGFPMEIAEDCTIGHLAMLHGCTIGDNSLVGMSAVVLNGARIGNNSLVGAGAVVTERKTFPDNSLIVGAPARVVRTLDEKAVEMIRGGADVYVKRFPRYLDTLKRIDR